MLRTLLCHSLQHTALFLIARVFHCAGVHHSASSDLLCPPFLCFTLLSSVLSGLYTVLCVRSSPNHRYASQHVISYHIAALCNTSDDPDEMLSDLGGQCSWEDRVLKNVPHTSVYHCSGWFYCFSASFSASFASSYLARHAAVATDVSVPVSPSLTSISMFFQAVT